MNINEQETKARILPFQKKEMNDREIDVSEVTRDLFTETWRSYLDQTSMAAVKLDNVTIPNEEEVSASWPKLTIV